MAVTLSPGHVPFKLTAKLRGGICVDQPYGLDLAGLLAAQVRRCEGTRMSSDGAADLALPLAVCAAGGDWHWAATCVQLNNDPEEIPEPRTFFQVPDLRHAHQYAIQPIPQVLVSKGPYRDVMQPSPVVMCGEATWWGVGDLAKIERLLGNVRFIGRRRTTGEGMVTSWTFEEVSGNPDRVAHLGAGDSLLRPCPPSCADQLDVDYRLGWYALRPPSWNPDLLIESAMAP